MKTVAERMRVQRVTGRQMVIELKMKRRQFYSFSEIMKERTFVEENELNSLALWTVCVCGASGIQDEYAGGRQTLNTELQCR